MSKPVKMYSTPWCPFCVRARRLFDQLGVTYQDIDVNSGAGLRQEMAALSGRNTVPQIWIGETHVGGYDELSTLQRNNTLKDLLA